MRRADVARAARTNAATLDTIQGHAAAALALLVLAHLQPDRFDGGWISVESLAAYTSIGREPSNVRRALDRARVVLGKVPGLNTEATKRGRKRFLRLSAPIPTALFDWFSALGSSHLLRGAGELLPSLSQLVETELPVRNRAMLEMIFSAMARTNTAAAFRLVDDHAAQLDAPVDERDVIHHVNILLSVSDHVLVDGAIEDVSRLRLALEAELTQFRSDGSHEGFIAQGQCALVLARCCIKHALLLRPTWPLPEQALLASREWLQRATPALSAMPHQDRGDGALVETMLMLHDACIERTIWESTLGAMDARLMIATACYRPVRHARGLIDVYLLRSEILFHRHLGEADWPNEGHAHECLVSLTSLSGFSEFAGRSDVWVIAGSRAAMLRVGRISRTFRADERAASIAALRKLSGELLALRALSTPGCVPYVAHAQAFLATEAALLQVQLPQILSGE